MKSYLLGAVYIIGITLLATVANAEIRPLEGRLETTPGSGIFLAYYDPNLDITWAADADINGFMNWFDANIWVADLILGGVSGWRLPNVDLNDDGIVENCITQIGPGFNDLVLDGANCKGDSEMAFLYWEQGITYVTPGPFNNVAPWHYWSSTESRTVSNRAWIMHFGTRADAVFNVGNHIRRRKNSREHAWPVRSGDVPMVVSLPSTGSDSADVFASILPTSRSVQVGAQAAAFATIINTSDNTAMQCSINPSTNISANFTYQATDPTTNMPIGNPNVPVDIAPLPESQTFLITFTPTAAFNPTEVEFNFDCSNSDPAPVTQGVNTLLLSASDTPVSDIIALAATAGETPGIVEIPGTTGTGAFAVATVNLGAAGVITVSADTGNVNLPLNISLCETNPATGNCLATPNTSATTTVAANATPTFSIFATGTGNVSFDPAVNRIFVRFADSTGVVRGSTSVAVRTQ